jgi:hypothetical protein
MIVHMDGEGQWTDNGSDTPILDLGDPCDEKRIGGMPPRMKMNAAPRTYDTVIPVLVPVVLT